MKLTLSTSVAVVRHKTTALTITKFEQKEIIADESSLKELFTSRLYSTNWWKDGKCLNSGFLHMTGITFDIDHGETISEIEDVFKDFNYILHTSTSHLENIASKGGVQDRYRIILPFDPVDYQKITTPELASAAYEYLMTIYKFVDGSCKDAARKYFPFLNQKYPGNFILKIHETGTYFSIDLDAVNKFKATLTPITLTAPVKREYIHLDDIITLPDKTQIKIRDTHGHTICYCIFCEDIKSSSVSGFVDDHPTTGRKYMFCSHCNKTYWLDPHDVLPGLFYLGDQLTRVFDDHRDISIDKVPDVFLNRLPDFDKKVFKTDLSHSAFSSASFQMSRMVDGYSEKTRWELDRKQAKLNIWYAPQPVVIKDNEYIENWLKQTFRIYYDFICDWLALYAYLNYQTLPVLIFTGERGAGKTTFAEFVAHMYENLFEKWKGEDENFNACLEKKLLYIEEKAAEKKVQYDLIKSLTGSQYHVVNNKYGRKYQVKNNVNIIMVTNERAPMYLVEKERPKNESQNQFFMYEFPSPPLTLNTQIGQELKDRVGYFIRTVLRERYERWESSGIKRINRYMLPTPMTPLLTDQYNDSKTALDYECEEIYHSCLTGITEKDYNGNVKNIIGPFDYINSKNVREIVRALKLENKNFKAIRSRMQALNLVGQTIENHDGLDSWALLRSNIEQKPEE